MFQYAFAKATAYRMNTGFKLDCSLLLDRARGDVIYRDYDLDIFRLDPSFTLSPEILRMIYRFKYSAIGRVIRKQLSHGYVPLKEVHFHVVEELIKHPKDRVIYDGWWQSSKYFEIIEDELRIDFQFTNGILNQSRDLLQQITATNSVCLNVRRTDFVNNSVLNTTSLNYFMEACGRMNEMVDQANYFVFSDDIKWCQEHLLLPGPSQIVGHEHKGTKFGNYLQLMAKCRHFIIPNSTFAWWAVWLNGHRNKVVIAPRNWFNDNEIDTSDLVPSEWIRL
jgi:hypothetical protein